MSKLVVLLEQLLAPVPGGTGRYSRELTGALMATAPSGWTMAFSSVFRGLQQPAPALVPPVELTPRHARGAQRFSLR